MRIEKKCARSQALVHDLQECMEAIKKAIGVEGAQQLWVPLLKQHSANPVIAQWVPLLACWLSSAAGAGPVGHQKISAEARPKSRSSSPKKPKGSPTRHGKGQETEVHTGASPPAAKGSQHERAEEEAGASSPPLYPLPPSLQPFSRTTSCPLHDCSVLQRVGLFSSNKGSGHT